MKSPAAKFVLNPLSLLIALAISIYSTQISLHHLSAAKKITDQAVLDSQPSQNQLDEVKYLPKHHAVELLSFGYKNVVAQIVWFYTQNYFGKHYRSDQKYTWLYHMCDLITTLDPLNKRAFKFAAFMLGWEAKKTTEARKIIAKAIIHHPQDWEFYYIRGSLAYIVEDAPDLAIADFQAGAKLPGAPSMMATVAATKIAKKSEDPKSAISFLENMIAQSEDPLTKSALEDKITEIRKELSEENK
jgi:hypothetical protein